jgi:hypothetical protein
MYATTPGTSRARRCHRLTGRGGLQVAVVLPCYTLHVQTDEVLHDGLPPVRAVTP